MRESIEFDVLFVGAGPATLAGAIHLKRLLKRAGLERSVAVIEKAPELGAHTLSGAVMNPKAIKELFPDYVERGAPVETTVSKEEVVFLTSRWAIPFPLVPPPLRNHGNVIVTLSKLVRWLGEQAQAEGVDVFMGFPGQALLYDGQSVVGVKAGEKGVNKQGQPKSNHEAGIDIKAKITVLGEGCHGSLTKELIARLDLRTGKNPQKYSTGVKELWEVSGAQHQEGLVVHTMGYPADWSMFGGGFIYHLPNRRVSIGWVVGLDAARPTLDPHEELQKFKTHPFVNKVLYGGKILGYGAKTIPEGGYFSLPRCYGNGFLIVGDAAGFMDSQKLKGIHLAMKSGMLAADTICDALQKGAYGAETLKGFEDRVESSWIKEELWKVRNFHQGFQYGFLPALALGAVGMVTGGWTFSNRLAAKPDPEGMAAQSPHTNGPSMHFDEVVTFKKLTDVYYSGTKHEEDQPCHLVIRPEDVASICHDRCKREYGNPCQHFCPANVYEMVRDDVKKDSVLNINFANCVHCKTCDIRDPYQVINWVTPEGGGGPNYYNL